MSDTGGAAVAITIKDLSEAARVELKAFEALGANADEWNYRFETLARQEGLEVRGVWDLPQPLLDGLADAYERGRG